MKQSSNTRKERLYIVVSGFIFALLILALVKLNVNSAIITIIFVIGWLVLAAYTLKFYRNMIRDWFKK